MVATVGSWCRARRNRWVLAAVVAAFVLRLVWVVCVTQAPSGATTDPAQYLGMADRFASFDTPQSVNGQATAFAPPGYSMALAPVAVLANHSGWFSLTFGASLFNVVAGTLTVLGAAILAGWWLGQGARAPTAWLLALAPGQIYLTSVALTETFFGFLLIWVLLAVSWLVIRRGPPYRTVAVLALGGVVGFSVLVRSPGLILLAAPVFTVRAVSGSWRGGLRLTALMAAGALVVLVPWAVRNAVQVGVLSPLSTNNAAFLCTGHSDYANGGFVDSEEGLRYCYAGSPFDPDHPDESAWQTRITRRALGWAVGHPGREAQLTLWKSWDLVANDAEPLSDAEDFGTRELVSHRLRGVLVGLADAWYFGVIALAIAGLAWVPACRRAIPLWATIAATLSLVYGGVAIGRYHHPVMPIMVVFAAGAIAVLRVSGSALDGPTPRPLGDRAGSTAGGDC